MRPRRALARLVNDTQTRSDPSSTTRCRDASVQPAGSYDCLTTLSDGTTVPGHWHVDSDGTIRIESSTPATTPRAAMLLDDPAASAKTRPGRRP